MIFITPYVYKITNTITSEFYYGYRYKNVELCRLPKNDIWLKYFTSSKTVKNQLLNYGIDAFTVEIIFQHADSLVCWTYEQIKIKDNWQDPLLLNGKYHDPNSNFEFVRRKNICTDIARQKMSDAGKGRAKSVSHKQKIAIANTGNVGSEQKRKRISCANTNKVIAINLINNRKVKISRDEFNKYKNIKYIGSTTGVVTAYDLTNNTYCSVSKDEFTANKHTKYVGVNSKLIPKKQ